MAAQYVCKLYKEASRYNKGLHGQLNHSGNDDFVISKQRNIKTAKCSLKSINVKSFKRYPGFNCHKIFQTTFGKDVHSVLVKQRLHVKYNIKRRRKLTSRPFCIHAALVALNLTDIIIISISIPTCHDLYVCTGIWVYGVCVNVCVCARCTMSPACDRD